MTLVTPIPLMEASAPNRVYVSYLKMVHESSSGFQVLGTSGATLRIYLEAFEPDTTKHDLDAQTALSEMISIALAISELKQRTGRVKPTVIT
jgi:hypothetical protein